MATACIKVRHLGDNTGKAFDSTFEAQTRASQASRRWQHKPMEAELAEGAAGRMQKQKKSSGGSGIAVPLMSVKSE